MLSSWFRERRARLIWFVDLQQLFASHCRKMSSVSVSNDHVSSYRVWHSSYQFVFCFTSFLIHFKSFIIIFKKKKSSNLIARKRLYLKLKIAEITLVSINSSKTRNLISCSISLLVIFCFLNWRLLLSRYFTMCLKSRSCEIDKFFISTLTFDDS